MTRFLKKFVKENYSNVEFEVYYVCGSDTSNFASLQSRTHYWCDGVIAIPRPSSKFDTQYNVIINNVSMILILRVRIIFILYKHNQKI